jgi:hypothetical protein
MTIKVITLQLTTDSYDTYSYDTSDISGLQYFRDLEILFIYYSNGCSYKYLDNDLTEVELFIKYLNTLNLPCCMKHLFISFYQSYNNKKHLSIDEIVEIFNKLRLPYGCESTINILIFNNDNANGLTIANGKLESNIDVMFNEKSDSINKKYNENEKNYFQEEILELEKIYCKVPCSFNVMIEKQKNKWLKTQNKNYCHAKEKHTVLI